MLLILGVVLPILVFMRVRSKVLKSREDKEEKYRVFCRYGFLLGGYKEEYYYWEMFRQAKKFLLIIIIG